MEQSFKCLNFHHNEYFMKFIYIFVYNNCILMYPIKIEHLSIYVTILFVNNLNLLSPLLQKIQSYRGS